MTKATLAGVEIANENDVTWKLTQGVEPFIRAYIFDEDGAKRVMEAGKQGPVSLVIDLEDGGTPLKVDGLIVMSLAPSQKPYLKTVMVADQRLFWNRKHVSRIYNNRRFTGEYHQGTSGGELASIPKAGVIPDFDYARYSLKDEKDKWQALQVVNDILNYVTDGNCYPGFFEAKQIPVENFEVDDDGQAALARAMTLVPNLAVYIDYDGKAKLTITTGGGETIQLAAAAAPVVGPTLTENVNLAMLRPKEIHVFFTPEDEIRFNWEENATEPNAKSSNPNPEPRALENVMPLPDPTLTITDATTGEQRQLTMGTWVPIDQNLINAWKADTAHSATVTFGPFKFTPDINFDIIQRLWFCPGGYNVYFDVLGISDPTWHRRWAAIHQHYRQTFRVSKRWLDRVRSFRAYRASLIDIATGTRAPSDVYSNYAMIPTARAVAKTGQDPTLKIAYNFDTNNPGRNGATDWPAISSMKTCQTAAIQILDEDQGIFHISYKTDAWGDLMQTVPSAVKSITGQGLPQFDPRNILGGFLLKDLKLSDKHAVSCILTCAPAEMLKTKEPALYKVEVTPDAAKARLPEAVAKRVGECNGPIWQLRIGAGLLTARSAWLDSAAADIEKSVLDGTTRKEENCINRGAVKALAEAAAGSIYSMLADRVEGSHVTALDPERRPEGRISTVTHNLDPNGAALTGMDLPPDVKGIDALALLPQSVRRVILKLVQN
jgi:hypothetical protein